MEAIVRKASFTRFATFEIAFRVLEKNDPALTQAFNYLKGKGVLNVDLAFSNLAEQERVLIAQVNALVDKTVAGFEQLLPLAAEFDQSWIPGRLRIRKQIAVIISVARFDVERAQKLLVPYVNRPEPALKTVVNRVIDTVARVNAVVGWYNKTMVVR